MWLFLFEAVKDAVYNDGFSSLLTSDHTEMKFQNAAHSTISKTIFFCLSHNFYLKILDFYNFDFNHYKKITMDYMMTISKSPLPLQVFFILEKYFMEIPHHIHTKIYC